MRELMRAWWQLLTFRVGGEGLPHAPRLLAVLLGLSLALHFAVDPVLAALVQNRKEQSVLGLVVNIALGLAMLWMVLNGARKRERFVQTAMAATLSSLAFTVVFMVLLVLSWPPPAPDQATQVYPLKLIAGLAFLPLLIWLLCQRAWILQGATGYRWPLAWMIAMALLIAESTIPVSLMEMIE